MPRGSDANPLSRLPSVDRLLRTEQASELLSKHPRPAVVRAFRSALQEARSRLLSGPDGGLEDGASPVPRLLRRAEAELEARRAGSLRRAINVTGVVLHTGLGRAVLSEAAARAVLEVARGHSTLEVDLETGERGSRQRHVAGYLCRLTGAEAALVVNNNAAAVLLALTVLARGGEVVVSRGQLVEIGGSFRIPDILQAGGARLVEVGTTNRTRLSDYRAAVTEQTSLLLLVHPSNYRIAGFTESVSRAELVGLGRELGLPVMEDLGSGALVDLSASGVGEEPVVREVVAAGLSLVTFSGDKLLGGPQAGVLVGEAGIIERCARHPLARAMRCDKLTLAALEATLRLYEDERALEEIPTLRALLRRPEDLRRQARRVARALRRRGWSASVESGASQVGGGALPGEALPTFVVSVDPAPDTADGLAHRLRHASPPVLARVRRDRVLLDPRTLAPEEERGLIAAFGERQAAAGGS